jgi:hypothetical protein
MLSKFMERNGRQFELRFEAADEGTMYKVQLLSGKIELRDYVMTANEAVDRHLNTDRAIFDHLSKGAEDEIKAGEIELP